MLFVSVDLLDIFPRRVEQWIIPTLRRFRPVESNRVRGLVLEVLPDLVIVLVYIVRKVFSLPRERREPFISKPTKVRYPLIHESMQFRYLFAVSRLQSRATLL